MTKNKHTAAPGTAATNTSSATEGTGAAGALESTAEKTDQPGSAADETASKAAPMADSVQVDTNAAVQADPGVDTAPVVKPTESVAKADKGSYIVASPIKHDGKDYAPGDTIRLPEATAHRLAGYLEA